MTSNARCITDLPGFRAAVVASESEPLGHWVWELLDCGGWRRDSRGNMVSPVHIVIASEGKRDGEGVTKKFTHTLCGESDSLTTAYHVYLCVEVVQ